MTEQYNLPAKIFLSKGLWSVRGSARTRPATPVHKEVVLMGKPSHLPEDASAVRSPRQMVLRDHLEVRTRQLQGGGRPNLRTLVSDITSLQCSYRSYSSQKQRPNVEMSEWQMLNQPCLALAICLATAVCAV